MTDTAYEEESLEEASLLSHLLELRTRLLKAFGAVILFFVALIPFAQSLFTIVSKPLTDILPAGNTMIATDVASPLITPLKLAFFIGLFIAMPVVLYQLWAFVAPGLYRKEKRFAVPLLASSILLFYAGIAFAYYVVFPLMFAFISGMSPENVPMMTDISAYLSFVLTLFLAFGLAFEVPVATVLLCWAGIMTPQKLASVRPYVFLGCFVIGMFLTPPDIISQTLLAIPVYLLFEVGIIMSRTMVSKKTDDALESDSDSESSNH
ncbi:MAG: twin-arginine translocase subunit TatC [Pseudomonadota bacterium]